MDELRNEMSKDQKAKCHAAIHTATAACGAAGAIPIPIADAIPMTAAQIVMVISLGKVFGISISKSIAKNIVKLTLAQQGGRYIFTNLIKCIPGPGQVAGAVAASTTAIAVTEALGWYIADEFFQYSKGTTVDKIDVENLVNIFKDAEFNRVTK